MPTTPIFTESKMIKLDNPKLYKYLKEKDELITAGRRLSHEIDKIEKKLKVFESVETKLTEAVKPEDLIAEGDKIVEEINALSGKLQEISDKIREKKLAAIPEKMANEHRALLKKKEEKELERNKIALKVQKVKDRVIPMVQKEVKPLLVDKYDDIESATVKGGKVVINTFNHLEEWKAGFDKRNK